MAKVVMCVATIGAAFLVCWTSLGLACRHYRNVTKVEK